MSSIASTSNLRAAGARCFTSESYDDRCWVSCYYNGARVAAWGETRADALAALALNIMHSRAALSPLNVAVAN